MLTAQAYLELVRKRGTELKELKRVYYDLQNQDLFLLAYGNIYANEGALTPGTKPEDSIDGMSIERINQVIQSLNDGTFRWLPARRIYIPKANGKLRPLGIPSWTDKLVQEAIRLILEAYYEPKFSEYSHGFRPNRGCHTALQKIKRGWTATNWFIEGDIKGCFDNIDHEMLLKIMEVHIKDAKFLKLIREMLKAGYMEDWNYKHTYSGTPQGGVLSPLLSNIYLNQLDIFVEKEVLPKYNLGSRESRTNEGDAPRIRNPEYQKIQIAWTLAKRAKRWEEMEKLGKQLRTLRFALPSPNYRRLRYIRYADDFLLGLVGTKEEAQSIKEEIRKFLKEKLKLDMSEEKTLITHAATENARFLGYEVSVSWNNGQRTNGRRSVNGIITFRMPQDVKDKWTGKYQEDGKATHKPERTIDTDFDIIAKYESEVRGLINYYSLAMNTNSQRAIKWAAEQSLVKTLALKHKQSKTWVYRKYTSKTPDGKKCLEVKIEREGKKPLIARFGGKLITRQQNAKIEDQIKHFQVMSRRSQLEQRLMANVCEHCGSKDRVEVHHIKSIKSAIQQYRKRGSEMPWWIKHMAEAYRKTIVVCHQCHVKITNGEYDGRKLS